MNGPRFYRSEDGSVTSDPIDLASLIQGQNDSSTMDLIALLMQLGQAQNSQAMGVGDLMGEQRQRAQMVANSLHPSAQYLPGFNPGGLFDSIANFMGIFNASPTLEPGQRLANRVPLSTDLGQMAGEAAAAQSAMQSAAPPNEYDSVIKALIAPLVERLTGKSSTATPTDTTKPFYQPSTINNKTTVSDSGTVWNWPTMPTIDTNPNPDTGGLKFGLPAGYSGPVLSASPLSGLPDWAKKEIQKRQEKKAKK